MRGGEAASRGPTRNPLPALPHAGEGREGAFIERTTGETLTQHSRDTPQFYLTAPSPCPYLPGREERKVFTHLVGARARDLNKLLTHRGFRRSQPIAYRAACGRFRACVSVRVIAGEVRPTRNIPRV